MRRGCGAVALVLCLGLGSAPVQAATTPPPERVLFTVSQIYNDYTNPNPASFPATVRPDGSELRVYHGRMPDPSLNPARTKRVGTQVLSTKYGVYPGCDDPTGCSSLYDDNVEQGLTLTSLPSGTPRVVTRGRFDHLPIWSPDGSKIAYASYRDHHYVIAVMDASGNDLGVVADDYQGIFPAFQWTPGSMGLVIPTGGEGGPYVDVYDLQGHRLQRVVLGFVVNEYQLSPNGLKMAFFGQRLSDSSDVHNLWVVDRRTLRVTQLTHVGPSLSSGEFCGGEGGIGLYQKNLAWSPDSRFVAYLSNYRHRPELGWLEDVGLTDVVTGTTKTIFANPRMVCRNGLPYGRNVALVGWVREP